MKQMVISILTSFLLVSGAETASDSISGTWITQKKDSRIEIVRNPDGSFSGKIVWADPPHREYVGTTVMKGVEYDSACGKYTCPWIYDPRLNITARAAITVSGDTMRVKAQKGILSREEIFTRVR